MTVRILFLLLILTGCGQTVLKDPVMGNGIISSSSQSVGMSLTQLPSWSNFSVPGDCKRSINVNYFDFSNMNRKYNFDYKKLVLFQVFYNQEYKAKLSKDGLISLNQQQEESLFAETLARVEGDQKYFSSINFANVNIVWVDPYFKNSNFDKLKLLMQSKELNDGHPVWISLCQDSTVLEKTAKYLSLDDVDIKFMGTEFFTPYDYKFELQNGFRINLSKIFENKNLKLITQEVKPPDNFIGKYKVQKIK